MQHNNKIIYLPTNGIAAELNKLHREAATIETVVWCLIRKSGEIEISGAGNLYTQSDSIAKGLHSLLYHTRP